MKPSVVSACLRRNFISRAHGISLVFSSDQSFPAWLGRLCSKRSWRVTCELISELISELVYVHSGEKTSALPPLPRQPGHASQRLHVPGSLSRVYRRHWEVCSNYTNGGMWTSIKTHFFTFYSMLETIAVQALSSKVWSDRHGRQLLLWHCLRGALLR